MTEEIQACPCLYGDPCSDVCTCVNPVMSGGCERCCSYGSLEQRQEKAKRLIGIMDRLDETLLDLINKAEKIFHDPDLNWESKYSLIFGLGIWQKARAAGLGLSWCDPDTTYEEDITAYMQAVIETKPAARYIKR